MEQYAKPQLIPRNGKSKTTILVTFKFLIILFSVLVSVSSYSQQTDKIQKAIDAIKVANNNLSEDYITDGQRTVWVKSYKRWVPQDFDTMKVEAPDILKFLSQAIQRNRYDVLDQLLPNYYRLHGGGESVCRRCIEGAGIFKNC